MNAITDALLSLVIPLRNEANNVVLLTKKIHDNLEGYNYQIIYVDDHSTDLTKEVIADLKDPKVHLIQLKKNKGQSLALAAGIDYAQGEFIITMDGDLQNDPADIPNMLEYAVNGPYDVVTGIRKKRKDSLVKTIPSRIANFIIQQVSRLDIKDIGCALKVFRKDIAKDLTLYGEIHRFIFLLAYHQGARIKQVPVNHYHRHSGVSKYGLERVFKVVPDMMHLLFMRKFFQRPIPVFNIFLVILILLGIQINIYFLIDRIFFVEEIGNKPLVIFYNLFLLL